MAEVNATLRSARVSGYKARLVANQIRGKQVEEALDILSFDLQKSAPIIKKVLESAIANAEHNQGADIEELRIDAIMVDEGPVLKRWRPRAKGRATPIIKRTCHITVSVIDETTGGS